jgi:hypothetical protein
VFVFPPATQFTAADVCFRLKNATAFQRRNYQADYCLIYQVAEGEKMNYKTPPKMLMESLPVPMGEWDSECQYDMLYTMSESEEVVREEVIHPSDWHTKAKTRSTGIPSSLLSFPVKKRSFDELFAQSTAYRSPLKTDLTGGSSSSSSSNSIRSPLFPSKK